MIEVLERTEAGTDHLPEIGQDPLFDAVLVHGYWLSQRGEGRVKPSLRSHIEDMAVPKFYDGGRGAGKIVLTAGHIWGSSYPSVAEVMKDELVRKYNMPEEDIIVAITLVNDGEVQEVQTTDDEVEAFLQLARKNEWIRLADIAARVHNTEILPGIDANIPELYKKRGQEIKTEAAEDIILESDYDSRIKSKIRGLGGSRFEWSFRLYEGFKRLVLIIKPDYSALSKQADKERTKKGDLGLPIISSAFPIDKYAK